MYIKITSTAYSYIKRIDLDNTQIKLTSALRRAINEVQNGEIEKLPGDERTEKIINYIDINRLACLNTNLEILAKNNHAPYITETDRDLYFMNLGAVNTLKAIKEVVKNGGSLSFDN